MAREAEKLQNWDYCEAIISPECEQETAVGWSLWILVWDLTTWQELHMAFGQGM